MKLMRACEITLSQIHSIQYPVFVSFKLDGIRIVHSNQKLQSRTLRNIPNLELQSRLGKENILTNLEGEVVVGNPMDENAFKKTQSYVMSMHSKEDMIDKVSLYVFDKINCDPNISYKERYELLKKLSKDFPPNVFLLEQKLVYNPEELLAFETEALEQGAEGIMIRGSNSLYKYGESTLKEMGLIKFKRSVDSEAVIIKVNPHTVNFNEMGSITVKDIKNGIEFAVGTGFTAHEREEFWSKQKLMIGKIIKYKYNKTGGYIKPRFPVFLGMRDPIDIIDCPKEYLDNN